MRYLDLLRMAWANLRRNWTRSVLTCVGVMVGVGALFALLAYGAGLEQNAEREFDALELYNTLRVTSHPIPSMTRRRAALPVDSLEVSHRRVPLTDSLVRRIQAAPGVLAAYPELQFPAKLRGPSGTLVVSAEGIPMAFRSLSAYQPVHGDFFTAPEAAEVLISTSMAERLGYDRPAAAVGDTLDLVTASLNFFKLRKTSELFSGGLRTLPMGKRPYDVAVTGLLADDRKPLSGLMQVRLPLTYGQSLNKVPFFSTLDLLFRHAKTQDGYSAVRVQLNDDANRTQVRRQIERMGVYTASFQEQFDRVETLFLILDLALGIIGSIAVLVAIIGIANTIMMNVRERTREIGVMMAVGGDARDLQRLFVVESGVLGALGGGAGLLLGGAFVVLVDVGVNMYLSSLGIPAITVFHTSPVVVAGIWTAAVLISVLAGMLPARRAARIEPAEALRTV